MKIQINQLQAIVEMLQDEKLLNNTEGSLASSLEENNFVFLPQLEIADSIHFHIHVPDIAKLDEELFFDRGAAIENKKEGYIKYGFPGSIKCIFSHIPVAQKEQYSFPSCQAYLDHIGIDIRSEDKSSYILFQQIPLIAAQNDFYFKRQGDGVDVVKCCHMQVKEKYWVYAGKNVNYEFAFGPLVIHETGFGIDLRPANPFNKAVVEETESCCGQPVATTAPKIFVNQN